MIQVKKSAFYSDHGPQSVRGRRHEVAQEADRSTRVEASTDGVIAFAIHPTVIEESDHLHRVRVEVPVLDSVEEFSKPD